MTYCSSFCISRLCPLLYITVCEPGINHFPVRLLHEMKEFIMVTVGRCEAFAVIYLGKMIDSLTMSEQCFTMGSVQRFLPHAAVHVEETCLLYGSPSWGSPVAVERRLWSHRLSSLLGWCIQSPGGGKWHFTAKNRMLLFSATICLSTERMPYWGKWIWSTVVTKHLLRDTGRSTASHYSWRETHTE